MNKKINIGNYEAYLLDYMEGTLDPLLLKEMETFLESHPEIAMEAEGIDKLSLPLEDIVFPETASLYQAEAAIAEEQAMELFSRAADHSLDEDEAAALAGFLSDNPSYERDYQAYLATRLLADDTIAYDAKAGLKHTVPLYQRPFVQNVSRIAAIFLVLAISIWYFLRPDVNKLPDMPAMDNLSASAYTPELTDPQISVEPMGTISPENAAPEIISSSGTNQPSVSLLADNEKGKDKGSAKNKGAFSESVNLTERGSLNTLASIYEDVRVLNPREHFKPEYAIRERISLMDLQWLTADPLFADNSRTEEAVFKTNISWLLGSKENVRADQVRQRERSFNIWGVADAGITAINVLTDNEIELRKDLDDDGNVVSYSLVSDGLQIARKQKLE